MNLRFAALIFCLAAASHAESFVHKFYVPRGADVSGVEWSAPGLGWDVSVAYDSVRCEVSCTYRRVRDRAPYLLPPAIVIRIRRGPEQQPETWTVDPCGTRCHRAGCRPQPSSDRSGLPGRGLLAMTGPAAVAGPAAPPDRRSARPVRLVRACPAAAPLRI